MDSQPGITIQLAPADDEPGPIDLRVRPDGTVRVGAHDLDPASDPRVINGWSVRVGRGADPLAWSGPELLIFSTRAGPGGRLRCPLPADEGRVVVLGRSRRACDVVVPDEHVSRVHLKFAASAGGHTVEDAQSRWGSHLNGRRLEGRHTLAHGDEIRVGTSTIRYVTRWDEAAFRPVHLGPPGSEDQSFGAETLGSEPDPAFEHVERPRTARHTPVVRQSVPPLWIGIGIGITMALVAMIIWTLVTWLWPQG